MRDECQKCPLRQYFPALLFPPHICTYLDNPVKQGLDEKKKSEVLSEEAQRSASYVRVRDRGILDVNERKKRSTR